MKNDAQPRIFTSFSVLFYIPFQPSLHFFTALLIFQPSWFSPFQRFISISVCSSLLIPYSFLHALHASLHLITVHALSKNSLVCVFCAHVLFLFKREQEGYIFSYAQTHLNKRSDTHMLKRTQGFKPPEGYMAQQYLII